MATLNRIPIAVASAAALLALACGSSTSDNNDSGSTGLGGATSAGGRGGTGGATDGGCVAVCGMVTGVLADQPGRCTFPLLCAEPLAFTSLVVFVDAQQVQQDSTATDGWNYVGTSRSAIELYGQACAAVMTRDAPVDVDYLCELALTDSSRRQ
jgi:hypothetical protein